MATRVALDYQVPLHVRDFDFARTRTCHFQAPRISIAQSILPLVYCFWNAIQQGLFWHGSYNLLVPAASVKILANFCRNLLLYMAFQFTWP
jgi:hypothetical protein